METAKTNKEPRMPKIWEAVFTLVFLIVVLTIGIAVFGADPHVPMFEGTIPMYILVSSTTTEMAQRMGLTEILTAAGAELIPDTCPDQPCWHYLAGKEGITESPKCAYYPRRRGINFVIRDLDTCIEAALTGEVG